MTASQSAASAGVASPVAQSARVPLASRVPPAVRQWQLEDYFDTLEQAERAVRRLRRRGVEATLSLIGGLSVLAYR